MGINYVPVAGFNNDVVSRQWTEVHNPFCIERSGVLEEYGEVSDDVNGISLRPSIFGLDDDPIRSREDGLTPTQAILQTNAENKVMELARPIETPASTSWIYTDKIVSISLAQHVGPVAWDFCSGSVGCNPFASEREIDYDWSNHNGWSSHRRFSHNSSGQSRRALPNLSIAAPNWRHNIS
jgi:hypothetical protein